MLTGSAPYPEGTVLQKLLDHQDAKLPDPREKNPAISRQLAAVVQRMMASNPDERYQRPDDLMSDLMIIASSLGLRAASPEGVVWSVPRVVRPHFWERNLGWVAMGAALLVIVMLLRWYPSFEPTAEKKQDARHTADNSAQTIPAPVAAPGTNPSTGSTFAVNPEEVFGPVVPGDLPPMPSDGFSQFSTQSPFGNPKTTAPNGSTLPPVAATFPPDALTAKTPTLPPVPIEDESPVAAPKPLPAAAVATISQQTGNLAGPLAIEPPVALPSVALMSESGNVRPYPTLEAACRDAVDGSVIVLNYDGRRVAPPERRMKVENKRITIRAGKRGRWHVVSSATRFRRAAENVGRGHADVHAGRRRH